MVSLALASFPPPEVMGDLIPTRETRERSTGTSLISYLSPRYFSYTGNLESGAIPAFEQTQLSWMSGQPAVFRLHCGILTENGFVTASTLRGIHANRPFPVTIFMFLADQFNPDNPYGSLVGQQTISTTTAIPQRVGTFNTGTAAGSSVFEMIWNFPMPELPSGIGSQRLLIAFAPEFRSGVTTTNYAIPSSFLSTSAPGYLAEGLDRTYGFNSTSRVLSPWAVNGRIPISFEINNIIPSPATGLTALAALTVAGGLRRRR